MVKFLRINNNFINLNSVKAFKVRECARGSVIIWIEYNNKEEENFIINDVKNPTLVANALHQCLLATYGYNCINLDLIIEEMVEASVNE